MKHRLCLFVLFVLSCSCLVACQIGAPGLEGQSCAVHRDCGGQLICVASRCQTILSTTTPGQINTPQDSPKQGPTQPTPPTQKTCDGQRGQGCDCRPQIFQGSLSHHLRFGSIGMMYSHDDKLLISQNREQTTIWNTSTGQLMGLLSSDGLTQSHMALSPDGKTLLVGGSYQTPGAGFHRRFVLWSLETYQQIGTPLDIGSFANAYVSNGGKEVWMVNSSKRIAHWQQSTGEWRVLSLESKGEIKALILSPEHSLAVGFVLNTTQKQYTLTMWDLETGKQQKQFTIGELPERALARLPKVMQLDTTGKRLALYYDFFEQDEAYIVDLNEQKATHKMLSKDVLASPNHIIWSRDLRHLAIQFRSAGKGHLLIFQTEDGRLVSKRTDLTNLDGVVNIVERSAVAIRQDGTQFAISAENGRLGLYPTQLKAPALSLPAREAATDAMFSQDGTLVTLSSGMWMRAWKQKDTQQWSSSTRRFVPLKGAPRFSPDGSFATILDESQKKIMRWNVASSTTTSVLYESSNRIVEYKLSHNGRYLAVTLAQPNDRRKVELWQLSPNKKLQELQTDNIAAGVAFSHDDTKMAIYHAKNGITKLDFRGGRLQIFSFATGKLSDVISLPMLRGYRITNVSVRFSPRDANKIYLAFYKHVALFDMEARKITREFVSPQGRFQRMALSPNGDFLVVTGGDSSMDWWETKSGRLVSSTLGASVPGVNQSTRAGGVTTLFRFSPDGQTLVLGKADGRALQWRCAQ